MALIGAVPPTIMAAVAWRRARKLERPLDQINNAVNHRVGNQKRLIELIDDMSVSIYAINESVLRVENDMQQHRAYHQKEAEYEDEKNERGDTPDN